MARWKGIGLEGFNTSYLESSQIEQSPCNARNHNSSHAQILDKCEPSVIAGISDPGNAFNYMSSPDLKQDVVTEIQMFDNQPNSAVGTTETDLKTHKQPKRSSKKTTPNLSENSPVSDQDNDEWQPDLSGWDISIGFPS
jgi:putative transposase